MFDNPLLDSVPAELLQGRVNTLDFVKGDVLAQPESPIERLIFPRSGLLSVVVELTDGAQIEAAMIGPGGALGGAAMFGAKRHVSTVVAQLSGRAWTLVLPNAFEVADRVPEFRAAILAQERYLLAQAQQTATCNAKHSTMERLCSWLLRARDEARRDELLMTQELLARCSACSARACRCWRASCRKNGSCSIEGVGRRSSTRTASRRMHASATRPCIRSASVCLAAAKPRTRSLHEGAQDGRAPSPGRKIRIQARNSGSSWRTSPLSFVTTTLSCEAGFLFCDRSRATALAS
jgi:CRP-like cAMP-binding protein